MIRMGELERDKLDNARTDGPISFVHTSDGLRPVGPDGWPMDDEYDELDADVQSALDLLGSPEVITVEPVSVIDIETTS